MEVVLRQMVAILIIQKAHVIATVLETVQQSMDLLISPARRFYIEKNQKIKAYLAMGLQRMNYGKFIRETLRPSIAIAISPSKNQIIVVAVIFQTKIQNVLTGLNGNI